jgi:hypothetical protein
VSRMRTLIVGIVLVASLVANVVLMRIHAQDTRAAGTREERTAAQESDERDILMELIPAITVDVGLEDLEAYFGAVYSGEPVGVAEDPRCIGCVVVSWRTFRFAFDEKGRLSKVSSTA